MRKIVGFLLIVMMSIAVFAAPTKTINIAYVEWSDAVCATNVAQVVLENLGYKVTLSDVSAAAMWESVATGQSDVMVAAWLPNTHKAYYDKLKGQVELIKNPLFEHAKIGWWVPTYVPLNSITELNANAAKFNNEIVGIDPGAGLTMASEKAVKEYGLSNFKLIEGSDATMTMTLLDAVKNHKWIVATGWTPHIAEAKASLKYLDDPKGVFGSEEYVGKVVRLGFAKDYPDAYKFLNNFKWTVKDFGDLFIANSVQGADTYKNAQKWVADHQDLVKSWIK